MIDYPVDATLVCVLSDISSAVIISVLMSFCLCGDRYLGGGATDRCESRSVIQTELLPFW